MKFIMTQEFAPSAISGSIQISNRRISEDKEPLSSSSFWNGGSICLHLINGGCPFCTYSCQVFKEEKYLKEATDCAEVIWQRGLLRKGYGICHGTAGNGYAFLTLYKLTQEKKYLYRACKVRLEGALRLQYWGFFSHNFSLKKSDCICHDISFLISPYRNSQCCDCSYCRKIKQTRCCRQFAIKK